MSEPVWDAMMELRAFLFERVYTAPVVMEEVHKATRLVESLFDYYVGARGARCPRSTAPSPRATTLRAVSDYIAGMTDRFAKSQFQNLFVPHSLHF